MANNTQPVIRSISLPSREHPCSMRIEALLKNLNKSLVFQAPHELNTTQTSLVALAKLYACVEELITNSPTTRQQANTKHCNAKPPLEQALEDSIALIDACNVARDALLDVNEHVQAILSALRRKRGGDSSVVVEASVHAYLRFRKKAKKGIVAKCLGDLKRLETNNNVALNDNSQVHVLREASSITASVFRSLLKLSSQPPSTSSKVNNNSGWSLVSKLMMRKRMSSVDNNLVADVDASLCSLLGNVHGNEAVIKASQKMLKTLNSSSENLISELDCMFRCLVKNRVSLLNVLTL